jgi:Ni/Co efflux regulator RcnB
MNVKHIGLATFAAALLLSATAFAADRHPGGGAPHAGAPHAAAAPRGGGGMPHGGGGFAHGSGVSHGGGVASFSHAAPSHSFSRGSEVRRSTATVRSSETGRGMEAPRGSTAATYTHAHGVRGAYGGMEHAGTATTAHDARGFGKRPSNYNNRPRTFDRGSYQRNASASARFHYGSYNAPRGYHYQRWTYGEYLPSTYWARDYWLTSWWMFDLAMPPYGYEWVRYGDDALLVNVDNGQILQVDYGVFY